MTDLRSQILDTDDTQEREMVVPEWGGVTVIVRALTAAEMYSFVDRCVGGSENTSYTGFAVDALLLCLLDPATRLPVFNPEDAELLSRKSSVVVDRLVGVMMEISGIPTSLATATPKG